MENKSGNASIIILDPPVYKYALHIKVVGCIYVILSLNVYICISF